MNTGIDDAPFWSDYRFMLVPGTPVQRPKPNTIDSLTFQSPPYQEEHKGTRGVVFFPMLEAARAYAAFKGLQDSHNVCMVDPGNVGRLVTASVTLLGCNVAFSIRLQGRQFVRDVTHFTDEPAGDGQHRWGKAQ